MQLTFLANVLTLLGRADEAAAAISEARAIGRVHADERILGYAAWEQARVAALRGDASTTLRWLAEAEHHPGDWMDHPTGSQFLAEAAELAAQVGAPDRALEYLARAQAHAVQQGWPDIPVVAAGVLAARFGDAEAAGELLGRQRIDAYLNVSNRWRITLLLAHAQLRRDDVDAARTLAASVIEQLEALGHPEFAAVHEPQVWPPLLRLVSGDVGQRVSVAVLGGFGVRVDGDVVVLPSGNPTKVVKLLAVAGRAMPIDELGETVWPESAPDVARRRLRNVLARVRAAAPILDRAEGVIALASTTDVDCQIFERRAQTALAASPEQQVAAARAALEVYSGELLPADRFEQWTIAPRDRLQRHAIRLHQLIADAALRDGDLDALVAATDATLAIDRFDDGLALRTASALRAAGRMTEAASWLERFAAIRRELGVPVPADLTDLFDPID